jgi:hypothetical protein
MTKKHFRLQAGSSVLSNKIGFEAQVNKSAIFNFHFQTFYLNGWIGILSFFYDRNFWLLDEIWVKLLKLDFYNNKYFFILN